MLALLALSKKILVYKIDKIVLLQSPLAVHIIKLKDYIIKDFQETYIDK